METLIKATARCSPDWSESHYITKFTTHLCLRRFAQLKFDVSSAAKTFQNIIRETVNGIHGTINVVMIFTCTEDHDRPLRATFKWLQEKGLTLQKLLLKQGISVAKWKKTTNPSEIRYLLEIRYHYPRFTHTWLLPYNNCENLPTRTNRASVPPEKGNWLMERTVVFNRPMRI